MGGKALAFITSLLLIAAASDLASAQKKPKGRVIVPAWRVQVVDESGNPVKGVLVRQTWQDYDVEQDEHHEDARSDEDGYVSFPARTLRVSRIKKALGRARHIAELGAHADIGVRSQVWAYGRDPNFWSFVNYEENKPLPNKIVLKNMGTPIYP